MGAIEPPGEVLLGIFGGGVPPGSSNPDLISDQKLVIFNFFRQDLLSPYPLLGLAFRHKLCHHYVDKGKTKTFFKCISNSHICFSLFFIWN